jgi:beta-fructofuranosidase
MLHLPDAWTWDFWVADTGTEYHLFFLYASRALLDSDRRHVRASIGHAVSTDLIRWDRVADALVRGDRPSFDDLATWTGSVLRGPDGVWRMFYTGTTERDGALIQSIGIATSTDLITWHKAPANPVLTADPRWYERHGDSTWIDEAWRDPWVFADPGGDGWHMLITARANHGPVPERGVVGHACSADLLHWQAQPPLSNPGTGFGQLEVLQVEVIDGRAVLLFSCLRSEFGGDRLASGHPGGIWAVTAADPLGPFDVSQATPVSDDRLYAGRLVRNRDGEWLLLGFRNRGEDGAFVGGLGDPMPWPGPGYLFP